MKTFLKDTITDNLGKTHKGPFRLSVKEAGLADPQTFNATFYYTGSTEHKQALANACFTHHVPSTIKIQLNQLQEADSALLAQAHCAGATIYYKDRKVNANRYYSKYKDCWRKTSAITPESAQAHYNNDVKAFKARQKSANKKACISFFRGLIETAYDGKDYIIYNATVSEAVFVDKKAPVHTPYTNIDIEMYSKLAIKCSYNKTYTEEQIATLHEECPKYGIIEFHESVVEKTVTTWVFNPVTGESEKHIADYTFKAPIRSDAYRTKDNSGSLQIYQNDVRDIETTERLALNAQCKNWLKEHDMIDTLYYYHCPECGKVTFAGEACSCGYQLNRNATSDYLAGRLTESDIAQNPEEFRGTSDSYSEIEMYDTVYQEWQNFDDEDDILEDRG